MKLFPYSFRFIAIIIIMWSSDAVRPPKTIVTNKCCDAGERLSENYECVIDTNDDWWPSIFMIKKKEYFPYKGRAPKFINFQKLRPSCENTEIYMGQNKLALFSNGTLYLLDKDKFIDPQHFCIDRDAAIVCESNKNTLNSIQTTKLSKIRKCCVKHNSYSASIGTCAPTDGFNFNDTQYDIVFGFPECKVSNLVKISESFNESNFDRDSQSLTLETGHKLWWQHFCVDHFIDNKTEKLPHIGVFTCADHGSELGNANTVSEFSLKSMKFH